MVILENYWIFGIIIDADIIRTSIISYALLIVTYEIRTVLGIISVGNISNDIKKRKVEVSLTGRIAGRCVGGGPNSWLVRRWRTSGWVDWREAGS